LRKVVQSLDWAGSEAGWIEYESCQHVGRDRETKTRFLESALADLRSSRVLDLGANDCHFAERAAAQGATTVAVDGDEPVLDAVYRKGTKVSIVLSDLTNPSPSQGWAERERPGLAGRARPELVVAYGLIHHHIYPASSPPSSVIDWLADFECPVLVEFVAPDDEMVAKLTANKVEAELHPGRDQTEFESALRDRFTVASTETLGEGSRTLYRLLPISASHGATGRE
jgi:hypothetical protein